MTINLTKITQAAGLSYLLSTVSTGDQGLAGTGQVGSTSGGRPGAGMHNYYVATGTPPGRWLGTGAAAAGIPDGAEVTEKAAGLLFSEFRHPLTGEVLGGSKKLHHSRDVKATVSAQAVAGYDLTFTIPKSVSVLFAVADQQTQERILTAHRDAIAQTMTWLEDDVMRTRSGRGGVVSSPISGVIGARYDHWDSRNGDPHLHSHVAVANRVQRVADGKWLTLDGKAVYRSAVAASEMHENLLLDELARTVGVRFIERERVTTRATRAVVLDVEGVPAEVVEAFASRDEQIRDLTAELAAKRQREHPGVELDERTRSALAKTAWEVSRRPKSKELKPLGQLVATWQAKLTRLGHRPATMVATATGRSIPADPTGAALGRRDTIDHLGGRLVETLREARAKRGHIEPPPADQEAVTSVVEGCDEVVTNAGAVALETVMAGKASWTRANLHAAASRLTRQVRCTSPAARRELVDAITNAAVAQCVPLSADRYDLPATAASNAWLTDLAGHATLEDAPAEVFTHTAVLDAESYLAARVATPHVSPGALDRSAADAVLTEYVATGRNLAPDQRAAALAMTTGTGSIQGLVGPAGTGKTTTVRAIKAVWQAGHGHGSVLALATAARAAAEVTEATGIEATTVAKFLYENSYARRSQRAQQREAASLALTSKRSGEREKAMRELARLDVLEASYTLRPGQLLVIDEASMTGTFDLAQLARHAESAGAKMLLIGDPAQLDSPGAGGFLGWMDRTKQTQHLTSIWRFNAEWEAKASLRLRDGDTTVFAEPDPTDSDPLRGIYFVNGRVKEGVAEDMLEGAYTRVQQVLADGGSAILIAATNDQVEDLNTRATLDRRAAGLVSTVRTMTMRSGLAAGLGDVVLLRKTDNSLHDAQGRSLANGDMIVIDAVHPGGLVFAHRQTLDGKRGAHLELTTGWLAQNAELGYATTAHRAQGVTVDEGHLVITSAARLTRELLYVAMSRGREVNSVWVGVMDEATAKDNHVTITQIPTARDVLNRTLAAVGAELTATEVTEAEHHRRHSLQRLVAEHDYLASIAGTRALTAELAVLHGADAAEEISSSNSFDALVATWRRAHQADPARTRWLLSMSAQPDFDPDQHLATDTGQGQFDLAALTPNVASILHQRLDRGVLANTEATTVTPPRDLTALVAGVPDVDADVTTLATQCEALIASRISALAERVATQSKTPPLLPPRPRQDDPLRALWDDAALASAIYADTWGESVLAPAGEDERRTRHQERTLAHLRAWTTTPVAKVVTIDIDPHADPEREWDEAPPEAWSEELAAAVNPDSVRTQAPDTDTATTDSPSTEQVTVEPFAVREHTDYEHRLTRALEAAWDLWRAAASQSWVATHLAERNLDSTEAGYAAGGRGRNTVTLDALRHQGFTTAELVDAGLAHTNQYDKLVDRFRDRMALPIRDGRGRLVGFTARKNPDDDGPATKYLNTAATALFAKAELLYGLTPEAITRLQGGATPVLGEGAMDAEAISTLGPEWGALATCGTSLTPTHLATLEALAPGSVNRIVTAFDPDAAGRKATARTWDLLPDSAVRHVRAAHLPMGADPAELVEGSQSALLAKSLRGAALLRSELIYQAFRSRELVSTEQAISLARSIATFAARDGALEDPVITGEVMMQLAGQLTYTGRDGQAHSLDLVTLADLLLTARDQHRSGPPPGQDFDDHHPDAEHLAATYPLAAAGFSL